MFTFVSARSSIHSLDRNPQPNLGDLLNTIDVNGITSSPAVLLTQFMSKSCAVLCGTITFDIVH